MSFLSVYKHRKTLVIKLLIRKLEGLACWMNWRRVLMDRWRGELKIEGDKNFGFLRPVIWQNTKEEDQGLVGWMNWRRVLIDRWRGELKIEEDKNFGFLRPVRLQNTKEEFLNITKREIFLKTYWLKSHSGQAPSLWSKLTTAIFFFLVLKHRKTWDISEDWWEARVVVRRSEHLVWDVVE